MLQNIVNKNTLTQNNIIKKQKTHTRARKRKNLQLKKILNKERE